MDPRRAHRVSEALKEELAEIIGYELSDPRLVGVTVLDVQISPDGRRARVRVSCPSEPNQQKQALEGLEHARHYLRREVSTRLRLFRVPELHFEIDEAGGAENRIEELLRRVKKSREKPGGPSENSP